MNWLNTVRGQLVGEVPEMNPGDIRFVPGAAAADRVDRAEMSTQTWEMLQADEELGRRYLVERSQAMRKRVSTNWSITPKAISRTAVTLETLEEKLTELSRFIALWGGDDLATSTQLVQQRREAKAMLAHIQERVALAANQLDVVEELLTEKVA